MIYRFVRTCLPLALLMIAPVAQALNENTTIVLHARDGLATCNDPQQNGMDCVNGLPTLDLTGMKAPWIYVMLRNYDETTGLQCAFDWPLTWTYVLGIWNCPPGVLVALVPTSPGSMTGTLLMAWDCARTGALMTLGRMGFRNASTGCLSIIESSYPYGTHVYWCGPPEFGAETPVRPENRGRVCAGAGGYDACWPASTPVESVTWGAIKAQYR